MSFIGEQKFTLLSISIFIILIVRMFLIEYVKKNDKKIPFVDDFMYSMREIKKYLKKYREEFKKKGNN